MILLTGASGFLGRTFLDFFKKQTVTVLGRANSDIICDLATQVPKLPRVDILIHAAGKAHSLPKTEQEKQEFFKVNVKGTENLIKGLEQASFLPKSFILISSVSVYGAESGIGIDESNSLAANDPYGLSKIQAEQVVSDWCVKNNIVCGILRLPLLVGANPPGNLGAMVKGIKKGYYFNIAGGEARKSMVMAEDVAHIIPKLAEVGGTYNLTDGYHPNFLELSDLISKQLGKKNVRNMPKFVAIGLSKIGNVIPQFPLNSSKLNKITSDLTFNDDSARLNLGWSPQRVLDVFEI